MTERDTAAGARLARPVPSRAGDRHWSMRPPSEISAEAAATASRLRRLQRDQGRASPAQPDRRADRGGVEPPPPGGALARAGRLPWRRPKPRDLGANLAAAGLAAAAGGTARSLWRRCAAPVSRVRAALVEGGGDAPRPGPAAPDVSADLERALSREFRVGAAAMAAFVAALGGWAGFAPLAGAVTVPGSLVVETDVKRVQHPTGGSVAEIAARDGMHVREGDVVVRLDATQTRMTLDAVSAQVDALDARLARLTAERDGAREPAVPPDLAGRAGEPEVGRLLASERALFAARAAARQSQKDLLRSHIAQHESEIRGLDGQAASETAQSDLTRGELAGVQSLYTKHVVPLQRVTPLQREAARLDGTIAQMASAKAQALSRIDEAKLQIEGIDETFRSDVLRELSEAESRRAELAARALVLKDQLDRAEIRAPVAGVVHQLAVHTVGGVVTPAEVIMDVVPDADGLEIEARLPTNQIDHVRVGQASLVRFPAFDQATTPQLRGTVSYVSADPGHDSRTGAPFYTVRVALAPDQRRRLHGLQLVSGMPAELFLKTGNRTLLSYLVKPLADQVGHAFTEP